MTAIATGDVAEVIAKTEAAGDTASDLGPARKTSVIG
jgi:hypothetical protein